MKISDEYLELSRKMHREVPEYGANGKRFMNLIQPMLQSAELKTLLDYGCGKGSLTTVLREHYPNVRVVGYDPAIPEFEHRPEGIFDAVICTDVLEHIEPECIDDVLYDLQELAKHIVVLTVSTRPAKKTLPDGRNTHILLRGEIWWLDKLLTYFRPIHFSLIAGSVDSPPMGFLFVGSPL